MSGFQQKDGTGALFRNEQKEAETHADYQGTLTLNGQEYWLNAWKNTAKGSGKQYLGVTVKLKQKQNAAPQARQQAQQKTQDMDFDDDIPF